MSSFLMVDTLKDSCAKLAELFIKSIDGLNVPGLLCVDNRTICAAIVSNVMNKQFSPDFLARFLATPAEKVEQIAAVAIKTADKSFDPLTFGIVLQEVVRNLQLDRHGKLVKAKEGSGKYLGEFASKFLRLPKSAGVPYDESSFGAYHKFVMSLAFPNHCSYTPAMKQVSASALATIAKENFLLGALGPIEGAFTLMCAGPTFAGSQQGGRGASILDMIQVLTSAGVIAEDAAKKAMAQFSFPATQSSLSSLSSSSGSY